MAVATFDVSALLRHGLFFLVFQSWPDDALTVVAQRFLEDVELEESVRAGCVDMCKEFHQGTRSLSERFLGTLGRHNYVTPTSYLELISTFKTLLAKRWRYVGMGCVTHYLSAIAVVE